MRRRRWPRAARWLALALGAGVAGCSTPSWLCVSPPGPTRATLIAEPGANGGSAVAVDLLFINDPLAAKQIAGLSAADYFAQREQLQRDFSSGIATRSWGLAPGQIVRNTPLDAPCNRAATLLFARYLSPGAHRQALKTGGAIVVDLGPQDFTVTP